MEETLQSEYNMWHSTKLSKTGEANQEETELLCEEVTTAGKYNLMFFLK